MNESAVNNHYLEIKNLKKYFPIRKGFFKKVAANVKAVNDVSFSINKGETLGLVGESGCGKTTTGRLILHLLEPTKGQIIYNGKDITNVSEKERLDLCKKLQIIFQDPYGSLNPKKTVGDIISEAPIYHHITTRAESHDYVSSLMDKVGLRPESRLRYPHEFSGGQRQRIGIARALALKPEFIVCDEPVSALDVSIQSQVLNLLSDLKDEFNLTYLFISHDLSVVKHISDRVAVLYLGKIVELGPKEKFFKRQLHPYSQALISAIPVPDPKAKSSRMILTGDVPSPIDPPVGCIFSTRCPKATSRCRNEEPQLKEVEEGHYTACFLYE